MSKIEKQNVAVLGAGSWGMALAKVLAENGHSVKIWSRPGTEARAKEINENHTNTRYFSDVVFPETITATTDIKEAVNQCEVILIVIPTAGIRNIARQLNEVLDSPKKIVHASKGLEQKTHKRISTILEEEIALEKRTAIVTLSGPSHAEEVVRKDLTSVTAASEKLEVAEEIQELFMNDYFRVYRNADITGVEYGGALKNIIALGAGALNGLGLGDNALAALVTRGLAEITRLGVELGAEAETFMSLSGVGDLIVTCTSPHSRNGQAGKLLGQGHSVETIQSEIGMVVEGLHTVIAAKELAELYHVEMPITAAIYAVAYEGADVKETILQLMRREGKEE